MSEIKRTPEFLKAAEELMPMLKSIPKESIRRHNLLFEDIINDMMIKKLEVGFEHILLPDLLSLHLPQYILYGELHGTKLAKGN